MSHADAAGPPRPEADLPRPAPAAAATAVALLASALLWVGASTGSMLAALDPTVDGWIVAVRPREVVAAARLISDVGQPAVMIGLLVVGTVVLAWRSRCWSPVAIGAGALALLGALDNGVKAVVARPRPPKAWHAATAHGTSFPSGHALWSAGVLLLLVVLVGAGRRRALLAVIALPVAVLVAVSRLVLAVHYPSDVLAGWALAVVADGVVLLVASMVVRNGVPIQAEVPGSHGPDGAVSSRCRRDRSAGDATTPDRRSGAR